MTTYEQEENFQAIADYDPVFELQHDTVKSSSSEDIKKPSAAWLLPVAPAFIVAVYLMTPPLANLFSDSREAVPIKGDDSYLEAKYNRKEIRPKLIQSARRIIKLADKYPELVDRRVGKDRIVTEVSGQDGIGGVGQMRLVTQRDDRSRKVKPSQALSVGLRYKNDDGSGNIASESLVLAAPKGERSISAPHGKVEAWFAHQYDRYTSGGDTADFRYSSADGDASLIADNAREVFSETKSIIEPY